MNTQRNNPAANTTVPKDEPASEAAPNKIASSEVGGRTTVPKDGDSAPNTTVPKDNPDA